MKVETVTPIIPVKDIDAACRFLRECLGFDAQVQLDGYAYCVRDGGAIRLVKAAPDADLSDPSREVSVYICADDVDAYFETHRTAIEALPEAHRRAPFDQEYGQREFHLTHGCCLFFVGQPTH
ncbi:MAG: VOC family protein [Pseudomonadota bacterium]